MAWNTYHNPHTVKLGTTAITGVIAISWDTSYATIQGAADDDTHQSLARNGTASTSGTITLADPVSASAVAGSQGTLTATLVDVKGTTNKSFSCENVSIGSVSNNVSRDSAASVTLSWIAEAAPTLTS